MQSLRQALQRARRLGCEVSGIRRHGEIRVAHPSIPRKITVNARRHDSSRALDGLLRRIEQNQRKIEPMAARKLKTLPAARGKSSRKAGRLMSEMKILRVLTSMGVDTKDFMARYNAAGRARTLSEDDVAAVKLYMESRDMGELMSALGTKSRATASQAITRAIEAGLV